MAQDQTLARAPVAARGRPAAVAPGRPRVTETQSAGDTKFYTVSFEEELLTALSAIAGQVSSCTFPPGKVPPSPDDVAVKADGMRMPRSNTNGWRYDADERSVVHEGRFRELAKAGSFKNVTITLGCPGVPVL